MKYRFLVIDDSLGYYPTGGEIYPGGRGIVIDGVHL